MFCIALEAIVTVILLVVMLRSTPLQSSRDVHCFLQVAAQVFS